MAAINPSLAVTHGDDKLFDSNAYPAESARHPHATAPSIPLPGKRLSRHAHIAVMTTPRRPALRADVPALYLETRRLRRRARRSRSQPCGASGARTDRSVYARARLVARHPMGRSRVDVVPRSGAPSSVLTDSPRALNTALRLAGHIAISARNSAVRLSGVSSA